ncbi:GFA family protein [Nitratireductor sp. XY-223]|uniref:GFA family protein n=1 Tax=Nitratireductor sp. XY-223 TaxID=2561926 RepID=UPI0010A9B047|nr:GFA family protein [Nitratireductor sp. XY-223]
MQQQNGDRICGGCACGAVRYETTADWEFSFKCHCRKCQRATGTGHAPAFAVPESKTELRGPIRYYAHLADSGAATKTGFCPECGSPIVSSTERFPERLYLLAGSLDDPSAFEPQFTVFESEAQPWESVEPSSANKT